MALQTQVGAGLCGDSAVRFVAGGAGEAVGAQQLVGAGDLLQLLRAGMAAIADIRLVYRHRAAGLRMRVVAVRAANVGQVVLRALPLVQVRAVMALEAQLLARLVSHIAMRIVTSRAVERLVVIMWPEQPATALGGTQRRTNLVRMHRRLKPFHVLVAAIAGSGCDSGQRLGSAFERVPPWSPGWNAAVRMLSGDRCSLAPITVGGVPGGTL